MIYLIPLMRFNASASSSSSSAKRDADISLSVAAEDKSRSDEYVRFVQYPFGQFLYIGATVGSFPKGNMPTWFSL